MLHDDRGPEEDDDSSSGNDASNGDDDGAPPTLGKDEPRHDGYGSVDGCDADDGSVDGGDVDPGDEGRPSWYIDHHRLT